MAAFLLDSFVFVQILVIAASLIWVARKTQSLALRRTLPIIAVLLLVIILIFLRQFQGDGDGLYAIGLIALSLIVLMPAAALALAAAAWFAGQKQIRHMHEQGTSNSNRAEAP
jgi:hypothetical protein